MLLFRTNMPNSVGWRCSGRASEADWAWVPLPSPLVAAGLAESSATGIDAQSAAAIQQEDLIIPSLQTSKMKPINEPTGNPAGANPGKLAGVCGAVMG
jgi:hypothetical protein